jgi:hypothetical protein
MMQDAAKISLPIFGWRLCSQKRHLLKLADVFIKLELKCDHSVSLEAKLLFMWYTSEIWEVYITGL